jgi:hypothetical protein
MDQLINARVEIERCPWLPPTIKELLYSQSVAVNTLFTWVDEGKLIDKIHHAGLPIAQVSYAHEVPPHFTRKWQYETPSTMDLNLGKDTVDITQPWLYGFIRHPNSTFTLVMFIRGQVIDLTSTGRPRIDPKWEYIRWTFDQYRRFAQAFARLWEKKPILRIVWALPGVAQRHFEKWRLLGYEEEVQMMRENNRNSARFVIEATRQTLQRFWLTDSDLILLGSSGTLGKEVAAHFENAEKLDIGPKDQLRKPGRHLVLDMTWGGSLEYYSDRINRDTIWLNESFPPPLRTAISSSLWPRKILHIQGVEGQIVPSFPYGYGDIPPCCMWNDKQDASTVRTMEMN